MYGAIYSGRKKKEEARKLMRFWNFNLIDARTKGIKCILHGWYMHKYICIFTMYLYIRVHPWI